GERPRYSAQTSCGGCSIPGAAPAPGASRSLGGVVCACSARTQRVGGPRRRGEDRAAGSGPALPKPPGDSRNPATAASGRLTAECSELRPARQSRPQGVVVPLVVWPGSAQLLVRGLCPPGRPGRPPSRPL